MNNAFIWHAILAACLSKASADTSVFYSSRIDGLLLAGE